MRKVKRVFLMLLTLVLTVGTVSGGTVSASTVFSEEDTEALTAVQYDLWVGATRVTSDNKNNIPGILGGGSAKYDPATKTLTFTGNVTGIAGTHNESGETVMIYCEDDLIIAGNAVLHNTDCNHAIAVKENLTIRNKVDASTKGFGVTAGENLLIRGELTAEADKCTIIASSITMNGSKLVAKVRNVSGYAIVTEEISFLSGVTEISGRTTPFYFNKITFSEEMVITSPAGCKLPSETGKMFITNEDGKTYPNYIKIEDLLNLDPDDPTVLRHFTDLKKGAWYVNAVQYVYDHGFMNGKGKDEKKPNRQIFAPNASLTRAEFATVLYNMESKPDIVFEVVFSDVKKAGDWYAKPVIWAYKKEIAAGYPGHRFGVTDPITREQLAQMMYKYAILKGFNTDYVIGASDGFLDSSSKSSWSHKALDWAVSKGIMSGKGSVGAQKSAMRLDPKGNATRAECAAMIKNLIEKSGH